MIKDFFLKNSSSVEFEGFDEMMLSVLTGVLVMY